MGWTYRPINPDKPWLPAAVFDNKRGRGWYLDGPEELQLPHFSTEIAAAWEVLTCGKWTWSLEEMNDEGRVRCYLENEDEDIFASEMADSAPEAICLAALRACGVEIEA